MPKLKNKDPDDNFNQQKQQAPKEEKKDEEREKRKSRIAGYTRQVNLAIETAIRDYIPKLKSRLFLRTKYVGNKNFRVNVITKLGNIVKEQKIVASFYVHLEKNGEIISNPPLDEVFTENFSLEKYNSGKKNVKKNLFL